MSNSENEIEEFFSSLQYTIEATDQEDTKLGITKRIIAHDAPDFSLEEYKEHAILTRNKIGSTTDYDPGFSLYPHGILLEHSTLTIKNPFLRVSHEALRRDIALTQKFSKEKNNEVVNQLAKISITNNIMAYVDNHKTLSHKQLALANT